MATDTRRAGTDSGGAASVAELAVYVVAGGYAVAGWFVTTDAGDMLTEPWLLAVGVSVGPSVLALLGALGLRRLRYSHAAWRHVGSWYLAGIAAATALFAWLVVGGGATPLATAVPGGLGMYELVAVGGAGGVVGLAAGAWRGRRSRRLRAPARLLEATTDAAWLFDADCSETIYVNEGYEQLFGQPAAALAADPTALTEVIHPDDRDPLRDGLDRLAEGEAIEFELRANPDDEFGRWVWLSGHPVAGQGEPGAIACIARDITSRRHHRERLVSLHDATRELFQCEDEEEAARIATSAAKEVLGLRVNTIWLHDDGRDELVPVAATEAAEADSRSLPTFKTGNSLAWEVFESGEAQVYDDVRSAPGGRHAPSRSEVVLPLGEFGVFMAGSTTTGPFEDWQVSLGKVLAANVEVALARIQQTRKLEESRRALEQRNERLDEFTSVVSHDLRNPLAVARGHLELINDQVDSESVGTIDDALQRMETLIDDLLTLAREGEAIDELRELDLDDHAQQSWSSVETGSATLQVDTNATVRADPSRLVQLFENLFRNSVEHGSTDSRPEADDSVEHGSTEDDPVTVTVGQLPHGFYVEDDGPGIPPEQREEVFEAGFSTDRQGTGFGLSIVQTICEAHGWDIEVTEGSEGGARFEVTGATVY